MLASIPCYNTVDRHGNKIDFSYDGLDRLTIKQAVFNGQPEKVEFSYDKLDVRGKAKSTVVCGLKVTAQNIKRLIKYLQGGYKPKASNIPANGIPVPVFG
ncbi:MAG: hypothetical protein M0021_12615 [Clostridia bacterium]|nr:hypothetical protein [Clostridia bacterium]